MNDETQGIRRERNIECFSRGLDVIRAIRAMWDRNKKEWAAMPWPASATINPRIEAIVSEFDLTVSEWHYWCRISSEGYNLDD